MSDLSSAPTTTCLEQIQETYKTLRDLPACRKIASRKLQTLSLDLALVALGVRTSYLFDIFSLENRLSPLQVFDQVVQDLRETLPSFRDVVILTDPDSSDYFFLNVPLFLRRLEQEDYPVFLSLAGQAATLLPAMPQSVRNSLDALRETLQSSRFSDGRWPPSITVEALGPGDSPTDVVPLAGVLLEYPVAYVPAAAHAGPFLSNVDLEVFTCSLWPPGVTTDKKSVESHTLLQFSCPSILVDKVNDISEGLRRKFSTRLVAAGLPHILDITHRTERLDRVAL